MLKKKLCLLITICAGIATIIASGGTSTSVSDSSGSSNSSSSSGSSTAPTVTITSPSDGSSYNSGQYVNFTGYAIDSSGKAITGSGLIWTSNIDQRLGTGNTLESVSLSTGKHEITLMATDSNGNSSSKTINVTMQEQSNSSPVIKITKPTDGSTVNAGDLIVFEGSGTDAEDGILSNNKLTWFSNIDKEIGSGATFTKYNLSEGKHTISLIGEDSKGIKSSASVTLTIQNTRPTAKITFPSTGDSYSNGETIIFNGEGTDTEDGDLDGANLTWISSIYGQFGTGRDLTINFLPVGTHKITLTVKDKNGAVDTASISITIK